MKITNNIKDFWIFHFQIESDCKNVCLYQENQKSNREYYQNACVN